MRGLHRLANITCVAVQPNRTYYLEDPVNTSHQWMNAIEEVRDYYFPVHT